MGFVNLLGLESLLARDSLVTTCAILRKILTECHQHEITPIFHAGTKFSANLVDPNRVTKI
jgi:hypothetical protein